MISQILTACAERYNVFVSLFLVFLITHFKVFLLQNQGKWSDVVELFNSLRIHIKTIHVRISLV
jgi:hypothetical protein